MAYIQKHVQIKTTALKCEESVYILTYNLSVMQKCWCDLILNRIHAVATLCCIHTVLVSYSTHDKAKTNQ